MTDSLRKMPRSMAQDVATWGKCYKTIHTGGVLGEIRQGDLWRSGPNSNLRLVVYITGGSVLFLQENDIYNQSIDDFKNQVIYQPIEFAGKKLEPLAKNLELAAKFGLGIVVTLSTVGFVAYIGVSAVSFVVRNKNDIPKWAAATWGTLKALQGIKAYWPTMYSIFGDTIFSEIIKKIPANISLENAVFCAGQIMGVLFKRDIKSLLDAVKSILEIVSKSLVLAIKTLPAAGKALAGDTKEAIEKLTEDFRNKNMPISVSQALDLIKEYKENKFAIDYLMNELMKHLAEFE